MANYKLVNADQLDSDLQAIANAIREKDGTTAKLSFPAGMESAISNIFNFTVVGGTTAPSSPKENTIWVQTDVDITSWVFSATEPAEPVEGMVWIVTGTTSNVEFNALKKNEIQVYPKSAKQYDSGVWERVTSMVYQSGEFVEMIHSIDIRGQIIFTTHSAASISKLKSENLFIMENGEVSVPGSETYNRALNEIMEEHMGITMRDPEIEALYDNFKQYIADGNKEMAEYMMAKMLEFLNKDDPIFITMRLLLRRI